MKLTLERLLVLAMVGMMVARTGVHVVRIAREWEQPFVVFQPQTPSEKMIMENYRELGR